MMRPNVLLIMTDQQRWDTLGCYGSPVVETPNLDWLAAEGTLFTRAYSAVPSCTPARAMLMTGMDQWHTGVLGMGRGQPPCGDLEHTLPEQLAVLGYHTQGVGKMHFSPQRSLQGFHHTVLDESARVQDPGFVSDYVQWFERNRPGDVDRYDHGIDMNSWIARPYHLQEFLHATNWTVSESMRFLDRRDPTRPFFLMTSFARPHSPYDPPSYYFDLYRHKEIPPPAIGAWAAMHDDPREAKNPNAWRGRRSDEEVRRARAAYFGLVTHIDHQVGRLLRSLQQHRLFEETIILFLSDHGDMLGDHHLWRKTYAYEGSAHIPLLVRLPRRLRGNSVEQVAAPVGIQDVMPTILDAVGGKIPDQVDGASLLPLMRGEPVKWRPYLHGEHCTCYSEAQEMHYLTDGRCKYIWFPRLGTEQLFDLERDPYECTDLATDPQHADDCRRWRQALVAELAPRDSGLTEGEQLVCQAGKPFVYSARAQERSERARRRREGDESPAPKGAG
jgi:arylsulfatase